MLSCLAVSDSLEPYGSDKNSDWLMWIGLTLVEDTGYYNLAHNLFTRVKDIKYFKGMKHTNETLTGD